MKKSSKMIVALIVVLAICATFAFAACDTTNTGDVTVTLSANTLSLTAGGTKGNLVATVTGTDEAATWSVDNTQIVSLQALGTVCSVTPLKEGTAVVTVSVGSVSATCNVTVSKKTEAETVVITVDGVATTAVTLQMGDTKTLVATASKGSPITWQTTDPNVVTVVDGVITAVRPGNARVIAAVSSVITAEVSVTVERKAGSDYYDLKSGAEGATTTTDDENVKIGYDEFFYWSARSSWGQQQVEVDYAYFENGKIHVAYTCDTDTGYHYGFQLMYKHSEHTVGDYYKLSCKINVDVACKVSLNGNDVDLVAGDNTLTVYYCYTDGLGSGNTYGVSSFDLVMGYSDGTQTGVFVQNAKFVVSDISWEKDESRQTLEAPSFTLGTDNVIHITDSNKAGVKGYLLQLYKDDKLVTTVEVEDGQAVDTSTVGKGEYTVKLVAVAANTHYIDSASSTTTATLTVSAAAKYTLAFTGESGAVAAPGTWTYFAESWVGITEKSCDDGVVTLTFSNNTGNWYDTQLFYKNPANVTGKTYKITVTITSPATGRVTINGKVVTLQEGTHDYEITVAEGTGASFLIIMGVYPENNKQEITEGTLVVSNLAFEEQEPVPVVGDVVEADEATAVSNPGKWIYWAAKAEWYVGGSVDVSKAEVVDNGVKVAYTSTGNCWFGMQLFYKDSTLTADKYYKLTLNINATKAGDITVNGKVITLVVGDNAIVVDSYKEKADNASVSIQFGKDGASMISDGEFVITNIAHQEVEGGTETPTPDPDPEPDTPSGDVATVQLTLVEVYGGDLYFHFSAESTFDLTTANYVKVNGTQVWSEIVSNGDNKYTFKAHAGAQIVAGEYTFVWVKDGNEVAKATYTYAPVTPEPTPDTPSEGVAAVQLTLVEVYGGDLYFHFSAESTFDLTTANYVKVNGTQVWSEIVSNSAGKYTFKTHAGAQIVAGEYTFVWVKDGSEIARATYNYEG